MVQAVTHNNAALFLFLKIQASSSLKFWTLILDQKFHFAASHTTSSSEHVQRAWSICSGDAVHQSQWWSEITRRRTWLHFVGSEFLHALHVKCFTLLGTSRDQIFLQRCCAESVGASGDGPASSSFKKLYPDLDEYCPSSTIGQNTESVAACFAKGFYFFIFYFFIKSASSTVAACFAKGFYFFIFLFFYQIRLLWSKNSINHLMVPSSSFENFQRSPPLPLPLSLG